MQGFHWMIFVSPVTLHHKHLLEFHHNRSPQSQRYENHRVCMRAQRKSLISFPASLSRVCSSEKLRLHVLARPTITVSIHMLSGNQPLNIYKDGKKRNDRKTGKYLSSFKEWQKHGGNGCDCL